MRYLDPANFGRLCPEENQTQFSAVSLRFLCLFQILITEPEDILQARATLLLEFLPDLYRAKTILTWEGDIFWTKCFGFKMSPTLIPLDFLDETAEGFNPSSDDHCFMV